MTKQPLLSEPEQDWCVQSVAEGTEGEEYGRAVGSTMDRCAYTGEAGCMHFQCVPCFDTIGS